MKTISHIWQIIGRNVSVFFALLLLSSIATTTLATTVKAAPDYSAEWINRSTVKITTDDAKTIELVDSKWDDTWSYEGKADNICEVKLDGFGKNQLVGFTNKDGEGGKWDANASKATLRVERKVSTSCKEIDGSPFQVAIDNPANATMAFVWIDSGKIQRLDNPDSWTFVTAPAPTGQTGDNLWFVRESEAQATSCQDMLQVTADKQSMKLFEQDDGSENGDRRSPLDSNCHLVSTITSLAGNGGRNGGAIPSNYLLAIATTNSDLAPNTGTTLGNNFAKAKGCNIGFNPLTWILCPLINTATSTAKQLDKALNETLNTNASQFDEADKQSGEQLFVAWGVLRNFAMVIFVGVLLLIIISQAIGVGPFDAYTIRKMLPRVLIAAILATLSWYLCKMLINISNDFGQGIKGLMYSPFGGAANVEKSIFVDGSIIGGGLVDGGLIFGGLVLLSVVDIGVILVTAFLALAAVFIGFMVIIARNIAIIGLVITAPLAAVFYVLPNTKKYADFWWDAFSKGLLMFPIIIGVIALGRVFAYITIYGAKPLDGSIPLQNTASDLGKLVIALVAFFGPYFFIPKTFSLAGGLVARIAGATNDRSRGLLDRARKNRQERMHELHERSGRNKRFSDRNALTRFGNKAAGWGADPANSYRITTGTSSNKLIRRLPGSERGRGLAAELTQKGALQSQDLAKWLSQAGFNQEALSAIMSNAQAHHGRLNEAALHDTIHKWAKSDSTQERAAAMQLDHYASFLADTWRTEEYGRANVTMAAGLAKASQGFLNSEDEGETAKISNYLNLQAPGLGDTFKTQAGLMSGQGGGLGKVGYSEQIDKDGNIVAGKEAARATHIMRMAVRDLTGAKAGQLRYRYLDSGVVRNVLLQDTANGQVRVIDDGVDKAKVDRQKQESLIDNIVQAAYGYDTPAETAAALRAEIAKIRGEARVSAELKAHLALAERKAMRGVDPAIQGMGGQQPPPAAFGDDQP